MSLLFSIQSVDEWLFRIINTGMSDSFFDVVLVPVRDREFWIPLYILITVLIILKYKWKSLWLILVCIAAFALTDQLSSSVIKPAVGRLRPCNNAEFKTEVILRVDACGAGKSFTSSHAANTFGFATILTLLFAKGKRWKLWLAYLWAFTVSFAQIYVGVHYPSDILGGALLGVLCSVVIFALAKKFLFQKVKLIL